MDAQAFADMRPGCYDAIERVGDMSANGVLASLNFRSWAGFAAGQLLRTDDKDLALAVLFRSSLEGCGLTVRPRLAVTTRRLPPSSR
jgi:hypothetical protein